MDGKIIKAPGFCSKIALLSTIPRLPTNITVSDFAATISYYFSMSRLSMSKYSYSLTLKQLRAPPALPHPCQLVSFGTHSPLSWPCPPRLPLTLLSDDSHTVRSLCQVCSWHLPLWGVHCMLSECLASLCNARYRSSVCYISVCDPSMDRCLPCSPDAGIPWCFY